MLFCPTSGWFPQLADDAKFAARCLAAVDAGVAQAAAAAAGEAAAEPAVSSLSLDDEAAELPGVFASQLGLPVLIILGQWDPDFESGRSLGTAYSHARMALHEEVRRDPLLRHTRQPPRSPGLVWHLATADPCALPRVAGLQDPAGQGLRRDGRPLPARRVNQGLDLGQVPLLDSSKISSGAHDDAKLVLGV